MHYLYFCIHWNIIGFIITAVDNCCRFALWSHKSQWVHIVSPWACSAWRTLWQLQFWLWICTCWKALRIILWYKCTPSVSVPYLLFLASLIIVDLRGINVMTQWDIVLIIQSVVSYYANAMNQPLCIVGYEWYYKL